MTTVASQLMRIQNGYMHKHKNICLRVSTTNLDAIYKVANKWLEYNDLDQEWIAQLDNMWCNNEAIIPSKITELELYTLYKSIPSAAIEFVDICGNTVAHRLVLALNKAPPKMVADFWYLIEEEMKPYMTTKNVFEHTPWELMAACSTAFELVLLERVDQLHRVIPMRSWRATVPFLQCWKLLEKHEKARLIGNGKYMNAEFICYITQDNVEEFKKLVKSYPNIMNTFTLDTKAKYPFHAEALIQAALDAGREDVLAIVM
jgi:hypothetical protein